MTDLDALKPDWADEIAVAMCHKTWFYQSEWSLEVAARLRDAFAKGREDGLKEAEKYREALAYGIADDEPDDPATELGRWRIHARAALGMREPKPWREEDR